MSAGLKSEKHFYAARLGYKMVRRSVKYGLIALSPFVALFCYFAYYELFSYRLIFNHHYHYEDANSIKHVYAAAQLYSALDLVLNEASAEATVRWLGIANEHLEQVIRRPKDPPAEVAKDLCNNDAGIALARWRATHPESPSLRELTLMLAHEKAIKLRNASITIAQDQDSAQNQQAVATARTAAEALRAEVVDTVRTALESVFKKQLGIAR